MTQYFKNEFYLDAKKQRNKTLIVYLVSLAIYLAVSAAFLIAYLQQPYASENITKIKIGEYAVSCVFVVFSFIYMGIKFKRVNKYYKLCYNVATGLKETFSAKYIGADDTLEVKDGVEVKALLFEEYNKYKKAIFERKVWVLYELPFPEIPEGAEVTFVTQGNVLTEYDVDEKNL